MMGQKQEQLNMALKQLAAGANPVFIAIVKAVDADNNTCTIDFNGIDVEGVPLGAKGEKDKTIIVYPKTNKPAIFGRIGNSNQFFMVHCAEAEKISIEAGSSLIEIENGLIAINGGSFGGLVKIESLVNKVNAIENAFNSLLEHYKAHNHLHQQGPTTAFVAPSIQASLANTQKSDIENTKVKH
jgi:hypothetical protein